MNTIKKIAGRLAQSIGFGAFAVVIVLLVMILAAAARGEGPSIGLPDAQLLRFRNSDGSCVQCTIGMLGVSQNCPAAEFLLWDSRYGPRVRGASNTDRVRAYCQRRGIRAWQVTGDDTIAWIRWACLTGRGAAVTFYKNHMVLAAGFDPRTGTYWVIDNNAPTRRTPYSEREFVRLHAMGGRWAVVLDYPPPLPPPVYVNWWRSRGRR